MSLKELRGRRAFTRGDTGSEVLQKLIPVEVLVFYQAAVVVLASVVAEDAGMRNIVLWVVLGLAVLAIPLYMWRTWDPQSTVRSVEFAAAVPQIVLSIFAFLVVAFAIPGGAFSLLPWWREWLAGAVLLAGTLLLSRVANLLKG